MCVCMCTHMFVHGGMCALYAQGDKRLMLDVFLNCSSPYLLRQGLSLSLELDNSARLAGQRAPGILLSPQHWDYSTHHRAQLFT